MRFFHPLLCLGISLLIISSSFGQADSPDKVLPKAILVKDDESLADKILTPIPPTPTIPPSPDQVPNLTPELTPGVFTPSGGIAFLKNQADIDLFTKGVDIGYVKDNPKLSYRRLVQRTMMPTEKRPSYGFTLTFDDQLEGDSPSTGYAIDIVKDLAPLNARSIFFANVPMVSGKSVNGIMVRNKTSEKRLVACKNLLESKREDFIKLIRSLIKVKSPADANGNSEYACEVFNHTAFHQNMSRLKVDSDRYKICIMGIEFIEECIDAAYLAERPGWQRARYFRFPFLHAPKYKETKAALNKKFTELGMIALGETQDSKDFDNYSHKQAYTSLMAAKQNKRYNPKYGKYGQTDKPIALFHTKTWPKIKRGVIKAIKEK